MSEKDGDFIVVEGTQFMADMILEHWEPEMILDLMVKLAPSLTYPQMNRVTVAFKEAHPKDPRLQRTWDDVHKAQIVQHPFRQGQPQQREE